MNTTRITLNPADTIATISLNIYGHFAATNQVAPKDLDVGRGLSQLRLALPPASVAAIQVQLVRNN